VNKDIPANTNPEAGQPLMPEDDLLTLSNFMMTSLLRKREDQITKLKNEMQEMKILEKVIKSQSESIKFHSIKIQEENEQLRKENDLLVKYAHKWLKQTKRLKKGIRICK
jgi:hypothetical protein